MRHQWHGGLARDTWGGRSLQLFNFWRICWLVRQIRIEWFGLLWQGSMKPGPGPTPRSNLHTSWVVPIVSLLYHSISYISYLRDFWNIMLIACRHITKHHSISAACCGFDAQHTMLHAYRIRMYVGIYICRSLSAPGIDRDSLIKMLEPMAA